MCMCLYVPNNKNSNKNDDDTCIIINKYRCKLSFEFRCYIAL